MPFRDRLLIVGTSFDGLRLPDDAMLPMLAGMDAVTGYGFYSRPLMTEYGGILDPDPAGPGRFVVDGTGTLVRPVNEGA